MYYNNKIHKTTKVMASLRILNIILKRFQSCFIHILANRAHTKFEVIKVVQRIVWPFFQKLNMSVITLVFNRRMAENGFAPPPPREFCRHILSCRELKAESFKRCLHSVLWGVSL